MSNSGLTAVIFFSNFLLLANCDNLEPEGKKTNDNESSSSGSSSSESREAAHQALPGEALLLGTLRTFERAACEENDLSVRCPTGTSISVLATRYGSDPATAASLCPNRLEQGERCDWPDPLQTVVEGCQKKRSCRVHTSPKMLAADPCPGVAKYVVVEYKCQPYEFRSKVACENEVVQLQCNPNSRIAVYSASYGRTQYESVQCPQPQGVPEETCLASYATETVMQTCHGKRRCTLSVDAATFGSPCRKESRMYLKVVYTCVPRRVLKSEFEERAEADENLEAEAVDVDYEEEGIGPAPNLAGDHNSSTLNESSTSHHNREGAVPTYWPKQEEKVPDNKERLTLYLIVSVGGGLVCLLTLLAARLAWTRRSKPGVPPSPGATELPPFTEELSEAEIDLTIGTPPVPLQTHPTEVVRYSGAVCGDASAPRSLSRSGNSQYYYG